MKNCTLPLLGAFLLLVAVRASAATRYVDLNSPNATPPFTDWSTAATNIQDAIDAAVDGDLVLVTNGVYATGGRLVPGDTTTNRVAVTKAVMIQSVNGPGVTMIQGYQVPVTTNGANAVRCAYLTNNAVLSGFTLTNGSVQSTLFGLSAEGGGVRCQSTSAVVSNCILVGNFAMVGGGAISGTLNYCVISKNTSGGVYDSTLNNCLVTGNTGYKGGGVYYDGKRFALNNCVIWGNSASVDGGGIAIEAFSSIVESGLPVHNCIIFGNNAPTNSNYSVDEQISFSFSYCCILPLPSGTRNFTNNPLFVSVFEGDFHLQSNSPCINAGNNSFATNSVDLDGNPRIAGGTVDIGAYEFQSPGSILSYAWAQQYGLPTDGSADSADPDGDGLNNWQEWIAGTVPTNSLSVLKLFSPSNNVTGVKVSWQSVSGKTYFLQRSTNLFAQPAFTSIQSNLVGAASTTVFSDTTATNGGPYFYRVGVQ